MSALLVKADDVATLLGISVVSVWRYHAEGKLPAPMKLGNRTLWRVKELENWVAAGMPPRDKWVWEGDLPATQQRKGGRK